jgi:hypothetical protein
VRRRLAVPGVVAGRRVPPLLLVGDVVLGVVPPMQLVAELALGPGRPRGRPEVDRVGRRRGLLAGLVLELVAAEALGRVPERVVVPGRVRHRLDALGHPGAVPGRVRATRRGRRPRRGRAGRRPGAGVAALVAGAAVARAVAVAPGAAVAGRRGRGQRHRRRGQADGDRADGGGPARPGGGPVDLVGAGLRSVRVVQGHGCSSGVAADPPASEPGTRTVQAQPRPAPDHTVRSGNGPAGRPGRWGRGGVRGAGG